MQKVISIVPRLPPAFDGVGDYAIRLACSLRENFKINTHFIVTDTIPVSSGMLDNFSVSQVTAHTPMALSALLSENPVLINYANYAFQRWGCPQWILKGLKLWRKKFPSAKFACMFHEVHNNSVIGAPWRHHMWAVPVQKWIARDLARLSDVILTSNFQYLTKLSLAQADKDSVSPILPVFSTIGEPVDIPPLSVREKNLVVFGQGRRIRAYQDPKNQLEQLCVALDIEKVIDIGAPIQLPTAKIGNAQVLAMGPLSTEAVSDIFSKSLVGYIDYSHDPLGKSSVFAAYCAYGMLPVSCHSTSSPQDGLHPGKNYLALDCIGKISDVKYLDLQIIADNARKSYLEHSIVKHAEYFYRFLL
jgi:hypothetical protein